MAEPPHPSEAGRPGDYTVPHPQNQVNNNTLAQLQHLAQQAQQHLSDGSTALLPQLGQSMASEPMPYNHGPRHDNLGISNAMATADILRQVGITPRDSAPAQQNMMDPSGSVAPPSIPPWSATATFQDLVSRMHTTPGGYFAPGADLLQASGNSPQVNLSGVQAIAGAHAGLPQPSHYQGAVEATDKGIPPPHDHTVDTAAVPPPTASPGHGDAEHLYKPPMIPGMEALPQAVPPPVHQPDPQQQPMMAAETPNTVLAAKILTESDVKHSRAILPRIAVENNLPFLLGFRTYGLILPDPDGNRWEFTIKSWANGRADRSNSERKKDRRVYVVEQMANFIMKNKLSVGDVIGFVAVHGHLQVHCQTQELRNWIERPMYGAPTLTENPELVPSKCSVLEDIPEDDTQHRQCMRSARCNKPDGHPGFCVGRQDGQRARNTQARLKLTYWPPPSDDMINVPDPSGAILEINPAEMPPAGVFLAYRVPVAGYPDMIELPPGSLIKVPISCASESSLRLFVTGPPNHQHELIARTIPDDTPMPMEESETGRMAALGRRVKWQLSGLSPLHAAHACEMGDEICIERQGGGLTVSKVPSDQLLTMPGRPLALNPPPTVAFGEYLCQRNQGCMKAVNHTGFCSGHRGFKRRGESEEGVEGAAPKKRRSESKRKPKAKAAAVDDTWFPSPGMPAHPTGTPHRWTRVVPMDHSQMIPGHHDVPPVPAPSKHVEVNDAADMLLALSGGGQDIPVDHKPQHGPDGQVHHKVEPDAEVPMVPPGPAVNGGPPDHSMHAMPDEQVPVPVPMAEPEEESHSYLELLQNAMTNLSRDEQIDAAPPEQM